MQQSVAQLQSLFLQRMDAYQNELHAAAPSANVTNIASEFTAFRGFIMTALRCLQDQLSLLVHQQDSMEMRSRRKMLLLHGVDESKDENTAAVVVKAVATRLKLPEFSEEHITRCHRMGRASAPDKPRPIMLKLRSLEVKNKVWYAKACLKGSSLTLSEFLTKSRHDAFMVARQRFGIHKCWTRDGFIFIMGGDGQRHRISSLAELEKIGLTEVPKPAPVSAKEPAAAPKSRRPLKSK